MFWKSFLSNSKIWNTFVAVPKDSKFFSYTAKKLLHVVQEIKMKDEK